MILKAETFKENFRVNLPGSWEMGFEDEGMFLTLRVREIMAREGNARISFDAKRNVTVAPPKLYNLSMRSPMRLQQFRAYRMFFDIDIVKDLPPNVMGMILESEIVRESGFLYISNYRPMRAGPVWVDMICSSDAEVTVGVTMARLALFDLALMKPKKSKQEKEDA